MTEETLSDNLWWDFHSDCYCAFDSSIKDFIAKINEDIDESADKTDIWDDERWAKFKRVLIKAIKKRAGSALIEVKK